MNFRSIPKAELHCHLEACEDAVEQGIRIMEFRYSPDFIAFDKPHLSLEKINRAILRGIEKAAAVHGRASDPAAAGRGCSRHRQLRRSQLVRWVWGYSNPLEKRTPNSLASLLSITST